MQKTESQAREALTMLIRAIEPLDDLERAQIADTLGWIGDLSAPLYRVAKPDVPPRHLVSYFALVDSHARRVLLVDHRNAGLWLPGGGHVEPIEHPAETVRRELFEELGLEASFLHGAPLFLTVAATVGATAGHTDVSLWYALRGDSTQPLRFDPAEFYDARWFDIGALPLERADPHLGRFVAKLCAWLPGL